jgi:hypothetical protein
MERVSAAAARALHERRHASLNDVLAAMGRKPVERETTRQFLNRLVAEGVIARVANDLYGPVRARPQLPGRSYVTELSPLSAHDLMVARA